MKSKHLTAILGCLALAFSLTKAQTPISFDFRNNLPGWTETHNITNGDHTLTLTALNNWYTPGSYAGDLQIKATNGGGLDLKGEITLPDNRGERAHIQFSTTQPGIQQFRLDSVGLFHPDGDNLFSDDVLEIWDENEQTLLGSVSLSIDSGGNVTNNFNNPIIVNVGQKIRIINRDVNGDTTRGKYLTHLGVTALVPEPSTYAFLLGLGALGFAACRRRRRH